MVRCEAGDEDALKCAGFLTTGGGDLAPFAASERSDVFDACDAADSGRLDPDIG